MSDSSANVAALAALRGYLVECWRYRHLMVHLARSDLRSRFRGSYLGVLWLLVNPLIMTAVFALVFGTIFNVPLGDYIPYVLLGIVLWEFIAGVVGGSTASVLVAEGYLKQARIPLLVFCLRTLLFLLICFLPAFLSVIIVAAAMAPKFEAATVLWFIPATILTCYLLAPLGIISAVASMRYRDYPNVINHVLTILYFVSPIFIVRKELERPFLKTFSAYNPITALCDIFREPVLYGSAPPLDSVTVVLASGAVLWVLAAAALWRGEPEMIHYF